MPLLSTLQEVGVKIQHFYVLKLQQEFLNQKKKKIQLKTIKFN